MHFQGLESCFSFAGVPGPIPRTESSSPRLRPTPNAFPEACKTNVAFVSADLRLNPPLHPKLVLQMLYFGPQGPEMNFSRQGN